MSARPAGPSAPSAVASRAMAEASSRYSVVPCLELVNGAMGCAAVGLSAVGGAPLWIQACFGLVAWGGSRLFIGTDATLAELYDDVPGYNLEGVRDAIAISARRLEILRGARRGLALLASSAPGLAATLGPLDRFIEVAGRVHVRVAREPRLLPSASRFMCGYLPGVADALEAFMRLVRDGDGAASAGAVAGLLQDASSVALAQDEALVADRRHDLEDDIKALRLRLSGERHAISLPEVSYIAPITFPAPILGVAAVTVEAPPLSATVRPSTPKAPGRAGQESKEGKNR